MVYITTSNDGALNLKMYRLIPVAHDAGYPPNVKTGYVFGVMHPLSVAFNGFRSVIIAENEKAPSLGNDGTCKGWIYSFDTGGNGVPDEYKVIKNLEHRNGKIILSWFKYNDLTMKN